MEAAAAAAAVVFVVDYAELAKMVSGHRSRGDTSALLLYKIPCVLCNCVLFAVTVTSFPSGYH